MGACAFAAVTARDGRDELQHEPEQETGVTHGTSGQAVLPVPQWPPPPGAGGAVDTDVRVLTRTSAATQPRGTKFPHLVPMFKGSDFVFVLKVDANCLQEHVGRVLHDDLRLGSVTIPAGTKVMQVSECSGSSGPALSLPSRVPFKTWEKDGFPKDGFLYVGRAHRSRSGWSAGDSVWANPFKLTDYSRDACISKYADHLRSLPGFPRDLMSLSNLRLVCHCSADQQCHADVIIEECKRWYDMNNLVKVDVLTPWSCREFVDRASVIPNPFARIECDDAIWRAAHLLAVMGPKAYGDIR